MMKEKRLVTVELTVPSERCVEAYQHKKRKYDILADKMRGKVWSVWVYPVKFGWHGFPA